MLYNSIYIPKIFHFRLKPFLIENMLFSMNLNPFEHRDDFIRMKFSLAPPRGTITFCKFTFIFRLVSHFRLSDHFRFRCHFYHVVRCHLWRSFWKCHFFLEKNDFKFSTRIPVLFRMFDQEPSFYSCYKLKNYFIFDKVPTTGVYYSLKLTIMPPVKVRIPDSGIVPMNRQFNCYSVHTLYSISRCMQYFQFQDL